MSDEKKNPESEKQEKASDIEKKQRSGEKDELSLDDDGPSLVERYAAEDEKSQTDGAVPGGGDQAVSGRVPPTIEDDSAYFSESAADEEFEEAFDFSEDAGEVGDFSEDFDDDDDGLTAAPPVGKKKAGAGKRLVAPLAVLLLAGGVGAYIVMNPDVIGGGTPQGASVPANTAVSTSVMPSPRDSAPVETAANRSAQPDGDAMPLVTREGLDKPFAGRQQSQADRETAFGADEPEFSVDSDEGREDVPREPSMDTAFADVDPNTVAESGEEEASIPDFGPDEDLDIDESAFSEPDSMVVAEEEAAPVPDESQLDDAVLAEEGARAEENIADVTETAIEEPAAKENEGQTSDADLFDVADIEPVSGVDDMPAVGGGQVVPKPPAMPERKADSPYSAVVSEESSAAPRSVRTAQNTNGQSRYFDAGSQVPSGSMATEIGPRKVDPSLEPAQKYMMVTGTRSEKDPEALLATANRALKLQRYDAAIEMFEQLYARNDRDPRILMGLAVSLQKAGRTDASLSVYDELIAVAPDDKSAVVNMLGLLKAQYPAVAVRRLVDLQRQYPNDSMIAAQLGVTLADMGEYDDAEKYIGMAISFEPRNAQHYMNMAVIADRQGNRNSAISYYEEALQVDAVYGNGRSINREAVYDRLSVLRR